MIIRKFKDYIKLRICNFLGIQWVEANLKSEIALLDSKYAERINTIHYYLNNYIDITTFPKAKDLALRQMQLCDVQLLRIVTTVIERLGVQYWLDYGTLLGAVRHGGFIPWDDDMDISVTRIDFIFLSERLPEALKQYDIDVNLADYRIGVGYRHDNTGIWLDIFPDDEYSSNENAEKVIEHFYSCNKLWHEKGWPLYSSKKFVELAKLKNEIFGFPGEGKNLFFVQDVEVFGDYMRVHHKDVIFPLKKVSFEGYSFWGPNDIVAFLSQLYGEKFYEFPKSGILHHDEGRGALSTWAKMSGTNMEDVFSELKSIADNLG